MGLKGGIHVDKEGTDSFQEKMEAESRISLVMSYTESLMP